MALSSTGSSPFYPEGCSPAAMFEHFRKHFDSVEINNSFYRLPNRSTFARPGARRLPRNFRFAVKASRFITHNKKLKDPEPSLARFFGGRRARMRTELREKLGPILFQLPPKWKLNAQRLADFLDALPRGYRYAFEFRENSWNDEEVYSLLRSITLPIAFTNWRLPVADRYNRRLDLCAPARSGRKVPGQLFLGATRQMGQPCSGMGAPDARRLYLFRQRSGSLRSRQCFAT